MNELVRQLQQCVLFRDLPEEVIKVNILPCGKLQELPKDRYLFGYQDQVDYFGVVLSGLIHTQHIFSDGSYSITDVLEPPEVVAVDLIWTRTRISSYYAVSAVSSQLLTFPATLVTEPGSLPEVCRQQIIGKMLTMISHDNIRKDYRLAVLAQKGLRERVMTYLTMQASKRRTAAFTIPFSREELASYLCVNRSALSHELSLLQQAGLIAFRKNEFTLLRWEPKETDF